MTTTLDKYGRILIPKKLRKLLGITPQSRLIISGDNNKIVIEPMPTAEDAFIEKDGLMVFKGHLEGQYDNLIEKTRKERADKLLKPNLL